MNALRDKLSSALGVFGIALYYALTMLYVFAPLFTVFRFGVLVTVIITTVALLSPTLGGIIQLVLYVWGFVRSLSMPFDIFVLIFYVCLALYFFTQLLPMLIALFGSRRE